MHVAGSRDGLVVASVTADPGVPAGDVIAAAHRAAADKVDGAVCRLPATSLFDLPLGCGPAWEITETEAQVAGPDGRDEVVDAVLPAWQATTGHDLTAEGLGFDVAAAGLIDLLPPQPDGYAFDARQAATARYGRLGFSASAVTAMSVIRGAAMPRFQDGLRRHAQLRFSHPYAVVAAGSDRVWDRQSHEWRTGPWHGMPAFSAWAAEAVDADR